ncbi:MULTISPECIES: FKBP-type peptidyl-prolyl cis-trans isomerase [unclassified Flavobacterium]|uniref:FKBP-type peptidyl-prolyl cis-trans isomerase n=1 Tax=unclassified Flavobacterium TaxID=196869 RepID=UPI000F0C0ADA|nr:MULTISPECIES: FKBP-type peptidylprolyl isomerase [unclassified Flavobacterium]AYN04974.1 FKBP-type peptidylprolyl isomerase [Flavobacterium sp. 140616W15]MCD0476084.1 FKBP-type peptidylprolyl isomerase [Flavobacterium sp. EDS]
MNKIKYYFILTVVSLSLFSCSKSDNNSEVVPLRDYAVQYATELADIEDYLKANYITVVDHAGFPDDQDVTITAIPPGGVQKSIWEQKTYELKYREVSLSGVLHKTYFLVLRKGVGDSPANTDAVFTSYTGKYLERVANEGGVGTFVKSTDFPGEKFPQDFFELYGTGIIAGWGEIFPQFKEGTSSLNNDGSVRYENFGAGVMFLPSRLAYYATGKDVIPSYAPLVFSFKLYGIKRLDHDGDGIPDWKEDHDNDGYMYDFRNAFNYPVPPLVNIDDTDKDGIPDFLDVDDDGDYIATKVEIKDPSTGKPYPFDSIPVCTPSGKKNYLDPSCYPGSK